MSLRIAIHEAAERQCREQGHLVEHMLDQDCIRCGEPLLAVRERRAPGEIWLELVGGRKVRLM